MRRCFECASDLGVWATGDAAVDRALKIQIKNVLLLVQAASSFQISDSAVPTCVGGAKSKHPCLDPFLM